MEQINYIDCIIIKDKTYHNHLEFLSITYSEIHTATTVAVAKGLIIGQKRRQIE